METYIYQIIEALIGILAIVLIRFANNLATRVKLEINNSKVNNYVDLLNQAILDAVTATNQTYVTALKEAGTFDESAQQFAFNKTRKAVLDILDENARKILNTTIKDLDSYIDTKIEACVNEKKGETN